MVVRPAATVADSTTPDSSGYSVPSTSHLTVMALPLIPGSDAATTAVNPALQALPTEKLSPLPQLGV